MSDALLVLATLLGPVLAVQAQKFVERWREANERRHGVFKTLMATRAARLSPDHIRSGVAMPSRSSASSSWARAAVARARRDARTGGVAVRIGQAA